MKRSLSSGAGYLQVDHRDSPGLTWADIPERLRRAGMRPVGKGENFEADVYQCTHCQRTIALAAKADDMSKRGYCPKCDHYICNRCEQLRVATGFCWSFFRLLDTAYEIVQKHVGDPQHPNARVDVLQLRKPPEPRIALTDAWRTA
jgi:predicted RNA-binding Zn-ribbon protein involved in translation (DUF1610 family)